jgi:anti-sigma-K factor RskA
MNSNKFWRNALIALAVVNVLFWAWTQGYLRWLGVGPTPVREPHRVENQVDPELLTIKPTASEAGSK